jgi:hypothetical protein
MERDYRHGMSMAWQGGCNEGFEEARENNVYGNSPKMLHMYYSLELVVDLKNCLKMKSVCCNKRS